MNVRWEMPLNSVLGIGFRLHSSSASRGGQIAAL